MKKLSSKRVPIKTRYGIHEARLTPDQKGYIVVVPSIQGVVTWGKNLLHAQKMAREAIELGIECLVEERVLKNA